MELFILGYTANVTNSLTYVSLSETTPPVVNLLVILSQIRRSNWFVTHEGFLRRHSV
jgi:hypothetical protein